MNIMEQQFICSEAAEDFIKERYGLNVTFFTQYDICWMCYHIGVEIEGQKEKVPKMTQIGRLNERDFTIDNLIELFEQWWREQKSKEKIIKLKAKINTCECCGGRLNNLKCEYCGAEYYMEEYFLNDR